MSSRPEIRPLQQLTISRPLTTAARARHDGSAHGAGALVWRLRKGRLQLLLVHRPRYDDWSWPKGKLEADEAAAVAAVREVAEETGKQVVLGVPLPSLKYTQAGRQKKVHYWAARVLSSEDCPAVAARAAVTPATTAEIDAVIWVDATRAMDKLSYPSDLGPLDALLALHGAGRLDTTPKVFVRHGRARKRAAWGFSERTRPLTPGGKKQARALIPLLAAVGVTQLASSPWRRCSDTLAPYAAATGVATEPIAALTESAYLEKPGQTIAELNRLMVSSQPLAICLHRPVIPAVLAMSDEYTTHSTLGRMPTDDPYLRTGEMVVAQVAKIGKKSRIVSLERMRPHT